MGGEVFYLQIVMVFQLFEDKVYPLRRIRFTLVDRKQGSSIFSICNAITKRYLGLRQDEILQTYDCLTF